MKKTFRELQQGDKFYQIKFDDDLIPYVIEDEVVSVGEYGVYVKDDQHVNPYFVHIGENLMDGSLSQIAATNFNDAVEYVVEFLKRRVNKQKKEIERIEFSIEEDKTYIREYESQITEETEESSQ